jgi:hypothetical protein
MIINVAECHELVVGRAEGDYLKIEVRGRMHPGSDDFWDGNWLVSPKLRDLG